jgi:hypothetical protein
LQIVRPVMGRAMLAQVGYRFGWPGFWIFLLVCAFGVGILLYLFMRSQLPPGGPRIGE